MADNSKFDENLKPRETAAILRVTTGHLALSYASRKSVVARGLDQYKASKGEKTSDIESLTMDAEYAEPSAPRRTPRRPAS
jgi:hypothetical protein